MKSVLLAGATGYLGGYIARELMKRSFSVRAIARNPEKLEQNNIAVTEVIGAEVTNPEAVRGCCSGMDVVISTIGITRQRDGLTYMDVDYRANMNLLEEAERAGVKKYIYISVLNGEYLRYLKICEAKERFVTALKSSGLSHCIVRPNGFFSDMAEFYNMAKKGRVYLFGNGEFKANPIHGADLAVVCVDAIETSEPEIRVGGPDTMTQNEMAVLAFRALGMAPRISHIPNWGRVVFLKLVRLFSGSKVYGPIEFFMTVMAMDMVAPGFGKHTLEEYFSGLD
jgi:uncharacterized protein YbjT (DUF2867 family)